MYEENKTEASVIADLASRVGEFSIVDEHLLLRSSNQTLTDLRQYENGRNRKKGEFQTSDRQSFYDFVEREGDVANSIIFVDGQSMTAKAVLNYGQEGFEQGHLDFNAKLKSKKTVTFDKLLQMHSAGRFSQSEFARFLEDWGHKVIAKDSDGNTIGNHTAVNSIRNMTIEDVSRTDSTTNNYRESRSKFEQIEAKSQEGALPSYFEVTDICYCDLPERTFRLRLSIGSDDGEPSFKLEIIALSQLQDELTQLFADSVVAIFDGGYDVMIGSFDG